MRYRELVEAKMDEVKAEKIVEKMFHDVEPWLREAGSRDRQTVPYFMRLFRGSESRIEYAAKLTAQLTDRQPRNSSHKTHDLLNQWFVEDSGKPWRNGVFTTSNTHDARQYGNPYIFMPVGEFDILWSPNIKDLWQSASANTKPDLRDIYDSADWQTDDLFAAIDSGNEIIFWCKEYYMINTAMYPFITPMTRWLS